MEATLFDSLEESERDQLCLSFGTFVVGIANGVNTIDPERDENNHSANISLPPMLPKEFATMMPSCFVDVVVRFRSRLEKVFVSTYIVALEEEHSSLRDLFTRDEEFHAMLDGMASYIGFHDAWVSVQPRFPKLCEFAGGLASMYPGTTRVESDFSVIGWEKDEYRTAFMDFSLEGIMHTKHFFELQAI